MTSKKGEKSTRKTLWARECGLWATACSYFCFSSIICGATIHLFGVCERVLNAVLQKSQTRRRERGEKPQHEEIAREMWCWKGRRDFVIIIFHGLDTLLVGCDPKGGSAEVGEWGSISISLSTKDVPF